MGWVPKVSSGLVTICHARNLKWNPNSLTMTCKSLHDRAHTYFSPSSQDPATLTHCWEAPLGLSVLKQPRLSYAAGICTLLLMWLATFPLLGSPFKNHPLRDVFLGHPSKAGSFRSISSSIHFISFKALTEITMYFIYVSPYLLSAGHQSPSLDSDLIGLMIHFDYKKGRGQSGEHLKTPCWGQARV